MIKDPITNEEMENLSKKLRQSAMFNLSLASKELFHSNFLAWLSDPNFGPDNGSMSKIFSDLAGFSPTANIVEVKREKNHKDLTIVFDNNVTLVIEVKIKSIPVKEQLEKYEQQIYTSRGKSNDIKLLLLSVTDPNFVVGDWKVVPFADVVNKLKHSFGDDNSYVGDLVRDYSCFASDLLHVCSLFSNSWVRSNFFFFQKGGQHTLDGILRNMRIHDLIYKRHFHQMALVMAENLNGRYVANASKENTKKVLVDIDLPNSQGRVSVRLPILTGHGDSPLAATGGIEIQHNKFRLFFMLNKTPHGSWNKDIERATRKISTELAEKGIWFDLDASPELNKVSKVAKMRKDFCQYKKSHYSFLYKYRLVTDPILPSGVVSIVSDYINDLKSKRKDIQEIVLKSI